MRFRTEVNVRKRIFFIIMVLLLCVFAVGCKDKSEDEYEVNLINGGDFEDDLYEYWDKDVWVNIEGFTKISVEDEQGNHVLKIQSNELNDAKMKQTVKVEEKQFYKLSGYIKAENCTLGTGANLSFQNMFYYTDETFDTNGQYKYVELYGKTAKGQNELTIFARVGGYSDESKGVAYFDDIRLEKIEKAPDGAVVHNLEETKPKEEKIVNEDKVKFAGMMSLLIILFVIAFIIVKQSLDYGSVLDRDNDDKIYTAIFGMVLLIGLLIRTILAISVAGYPNDIGCWIGWSSVAVDKGIVGLYDGQTFIDYPPGYMYILYAVGWLNKIPFLSNAAAATVKIPPILADIAMSMIIFKLAKTKLSDRAGLLLASLYFLSPAIITDSAAWGQIDSLLALMTIGYLIYLNKRNFIIAGIFLGAGVLIKPQMLLFAPVYILAWFYYLRETNIKKATVEFFKGVVAGLGAFLIISLPLIIGYGFKYIIDMYINILSSYSSVSLNACNIWPLLGGMWEKVETPFLGVTYNFWGYVGLVVSVLIFFVVSMKDKNHKNIFFHAALLITGIFMLSGKMHERYMYPAMALLLFSYIYTKDRRHFVLFGIFTVTQFANTSLVLANQYIFGMSIGEFFGSMTTVDSIGEWLTQYDMNLWTTAISIAAVAGYIYMIYVGLKPVDKDKQAQIDEYIKEDHKVAKAERKVKIAEDITDKEYGGLVKSLGKKDYLFMGIATLVYACFAFINLGNTYGPETMWNVNSPSQEVVVDFGTDVEIDKVMFFRAQGTNGSNFTIDFAGTNTDAEYYTSYYYQIGEEGTLDNMRELIIEENNMIGESPAIMFSNYPAIFKWYTMDSYDIARYAKITVHRPMMRLVEMVFIDPDGNVIPVKDIIVADEKSNDAALMFDEQGMVPEKNTYMNSTYFDEIYHAGTAWEHLMRYNPYETTHPPLGKVIISIGIKIFGMNPFGWRIMGTIIGILMVSIMYLLAMVIFRKTKYAAIATILLMFDFMHFTQTRIATIDSYGVFFIMLMFLCMGIYYRMSFYKSSLVKTLIPLGLSGIFFGLGAASKWICLYAGAGLAVVFFYTLFRRYKEYALVQRCESQDCGITEEMAENIKKKFKKYTWITLIFCIIFFIIIPIGIYAASYIPILQAEEGRGLEYVVDAQEYMYAYHSGLNGEHGFASPWYEWPLIVKPMWYYSDSTLYGTGQMTSIAAFGNPAVWWLGAAAFIWLLVNMFKARRINKMQLFVLIGFLAQFLPWIPITRSTFIYHYFASVPFIILMTVMMIRNLEENKKWYRKEITYIYLAVVVMLFGLFYPVIAGIQIPSGYGQILKWMPTWWFIY